MNKFTGFMAILLILAISAMIATSEQVVTQEISLDNTGSIITGIVTSWNGTPVANAYVYTKGSGYVSSSTDSNGNYSLVGLQAGNYVVYACPPYGNLSLNSTNVTVRIGETSIANIILQIRTIIPPFLKSVEIRGEVAEGTFVWDAYNFPALFYDFHDDVKTETLNISYINGRIIPPGQLIYSTTPQEVAFAHSNFGKYQVIGFMAEKYFAGYTSNTTSLNPDTNFSNMSTYANGQLHKVLIDDDTKRTIPVGGTIALQEGYVLKVTDIDISARTILMSLLKDGNEVDMMPLSADETYVYTENISGVENFPLIMVRIDNVFVGTELQVAFLKGLFQLSENATSFKLGDKFDKMNITNVTLDAITMNNYLNISLDKNTNIVLLGNIQLKVADNDTLRVYPFVEFTKPGKCEVRGPVLNGSTMPSLTGRIFGGFYYDLDLDRQSESLNFTQPLSAISSRLIAKNELEYRTTKVPVEFKAYQMEKVHVAGPDGTTYDLVGWQGEKWVAIKGHTNKIAKLALEMNTEDKNILTTGETWSLGSGYDITINAIDARTTPRQVWITLRKDGSVVIDKVCQAQQSSSIADKEKGVCYLTKTILGESDALLFMVYVDSIFSGATYDLVQFKYAWLIDESSAKEIKSADKFEVFEVRSATSDYIRMTNEETVNLSGNTETTLMGELKLKVADSDNLRFYPKIDYIIGQTPVLTTITVLPTNATVIVGNTTTFTATTLDQNGEALDATVTWSSSNDSVGTIAFSGVFTAVAAGTTTITAQSANVSGAATVTVNAALEPLLVFATTPNSRNAQVGTPITIFMTVINGGTATATNVSITQESSLPVTVSYQQWNGTAFIGLPNTPSDIAAGAQADYVLTINATSAFTTSSLTFNASSTNGATASINGVNTLTISASSVPCADIIMMATGTDYRTVVGTATAFAVATMNVGTAAATGVSFEVSVPSSITGLVTVVNETNLDGTIKGPATGLTIAVGATPTFAVFITPTQSITLDLENNRIKLLLVDGTGKIIGEQSVAVSTT